MVIHLKDNFCMVIVHYSDTVDWQLTRYGEPLIEGSIKGTDRSQKAIAGCIAQDLIDTLVRPLLEGMDSGLCVSLVEED